jgi:hypothetical protein
MFRYGMPSQVRKRLVWGAGSVDSTGRGSWGKVLRVRGVGVGDRRGLLCLLVYVSFPKVCRTEMKLVL